MSETLFSGDIGSGGYPIRTLHDLSDSPIALWQLEEDLQDASGNAKHLTPVNATWGAGFVDDSKVAWYNLTGASKGTHAHDAVFTVLGALTFAALIRPNDSGVPQKMISYTNGGGGADNMLYQLDMISNTLRYNHQNGGGPVNNTLTSTYIVQPWRWQHIGFTRNVAGTLVKLFVNGKKIATSGPFANPPDGGANSTLNVMGYHGAVDPWLGGMQSAILIGSEISEADMLTMSNARFGI